MSVPQILSATLPIRSAAPAPETDGELLDRFVCLRDDDAFALLMARHGSLVYGVSRRLLSISADADDVCQATFLVLARKAATLRRERSLAGWLVGVARKLAGDIRKHNRRRRHRERKAAGDARTVERRDASIVASSREAAQLLDTEITALPRKYREPILLCCLEGLPKAVVAERLGWPEGTVAGRVSRAKVLLRTRLERQGVLPAVAVALVGGASQAHAAPPALTLDACRAARDRPGDLIPLVSAGAYSLFQGALQPMWHTQWKLTAAAALAAVSLGWAGWGLMTPITAQDRPAIAQTTSALQNDDKKALQGTWHCVAIVFGGKVPEDARANAEKIKNSTWIRFSEGKIEISGSPSERQPVPYTLSPGSPKLIDIQAGDMTLKGAYALTDGVLLLRFNEGPKGNDRPSSLAVDANASGALLVLQRERPQKVAEGAAPVARQAGVTREITMSKMRQIGLAQHIHADAQDPKQGSRLAGNICDKSGKPLLSWRVKLLPYLEQDHLYRQFKLNEPWDSPHNQALLKEMPAVYALTQKKPADSTTPFRMFVGPGAFVNGNETRFQDIKDGTSNTFLFVEAAEGVPWTKPDDLVFDPTKPLPKLGQPTEESFLVCLCDGSVRSLRRDLKPESLKKMITLAGGEVIEQNEWGK
jgi:RNA polymerase sigma factor (sigma-70 family)